MNIEEWTPYTGDYEKRFYDLRFPNGNVYCGIWPNAGQFHIPAEQRAFDHDRVLTERDNFEIRPSLIDALGVPVRETNA